MLKEFKLAGQIIIFFGGGDYWYFIYLNTLIKLFIKPSQQTFCSLDIRFRDDANETL